MRRLVSPRWTAACLLVTTIATADAAPPTQPLRAAEGVYVGGAPTDATAWDALVARGVKTVVGVEGIPPSPPSGSSEGLRLVHIPIGYGAIDKAASDRLTRVAREAQRPLYIYCHHGQHRGPAAAAIVCLAANLLDKEGALDLLRRAQTDRKYAGLWRDVAAYRAPPADAVLPELTPASPSSPLSLAMCQLDRAWEATLKSDTREDRHTAMVLVVESLKESRRAVEATGARPGLLADLQEALDQAREIEHAATGLDPEELDQRFGPQCLRCHATHRDTTD
ncbi:hypothetical protein MalM25_36390 [Planctomycetes bacterium MalM25]|nr:hypothetical protein MalM25_36390 [Planctomycetes bacterium MalM25]